MKNNKYIKLYACCIPVKGVCRSLIVDTNRGGFKFIPNDLYQILTEELSFTTQEIYQRYSDDRETLSEYFDFLEKNEFIFYTDEPESFPLISEDWEIPNTISNAIIDLAKHSNYDVLKAITEIDKLGADAVQIRIFDCVSISWLSNLLKNITILTKRIRILELYIKFNEAIEVDILEDELMKFSLLSYIVIHSSFKEEIKSEAGFLFVYIKDTIENQSHCGIIKPALFTTSLNHVLEAKNFNTCLNKKISIDSFGNIKNCPSMIQSFGNISDTLLENIIGLSTFQKKWNINKSMIDVCKDCEFRLICSDCRAYLSDDYKKPLKCSYDPYSATWNDSKTM